MKGGSHKTKLMFILIVIMVCLLMPAMINAQDRSFFENEKRVERVDFKKAKRDPVFRAVPLRLNYQGFLTDDAGAPINGVVTMVFKIFDAESLGGELWSSGNEPITVEDGVFHYILDGVPLSIFHDGDPRWMELTVNGEVLQPRTEITSVPWAYYATFSDSAGQGGSDSNWVLIGNVLYPRGNYGLAMRQNNVLYGNGDSTHVNFGIECTTGVSGQNEYYCTIGGGHNNTANEDYTTISGGGYNKALIYAATVGGGLVNRAEGYISTVAGGEMNRAEGMFSTVGGGQLNRATGDFSVVSGGEMNQSIGFCNSIIGGWNNRANSDYSTICGGELNIADSSDYITISGGFWNEAYGGGSVIAGGYGNITRGGSSTVSGGSSNWANEMYSTVGGGLGNSASGMGGTVCGGELNIVYSNYAAICGGYFNQVWGRNTSISGGSGNVAHGNYSIIGGGEYNTVDTCNYATIGGGTDNNASEEYATIGGGIHNIANGWGATISGGENNTASNIGSTIGGGNLNWAHAVGATIAGGFSNEVSGDGATVAGGSDNNATGLRSFVGGGQLNTATGEYAAVNGGILCFANGDYSAIAGGENNNAGGDYSSIPGGFGNQITANGNYSMAFGQSVYIDNPNRVVFFDGFASGRLGINRDDNSGGILHPIHVGTDGTNGNGAHLTAGGTWTNGSSRAFKENFNEIKGSEVIEKVNSLNIMRWKYKSTDEYHIGPVSEDFHEIFDVGCDNRYLASSDVAGVALCAIQELSRQLVEQRRTNVEYEEELKQLKNEIESLKELVYSTN